MSLPGVAQMRGRASLRIAPPRTIRRRVRERVTSFLGGSDLSFERNFLIVRPAIAALVALSAVIQGDGVPGRAGVLAGCGTAILSMYAHINPPPSFLQYSSDTVGSTGSP